MRIYLPQIDWKGWSLLFAVVLTLSLSPVSAQVADQPLSDLSISDAIEDELMLDPAVPANRIDVQTEDGVVTLTGTVSNILAQERAARIAETVKGVRAVVNNIEVQPLEIRLDRQIRTDIEEALFINPATENEEVTVNVEEGVATLSGTVKSWQERQIVEKVVKGVRGVIGVNNDIQVVYATERPDQEIEAEIQQALRWDALVDDALIEVAVDDGRARLTGTVGSASEKSRAINKAWVNGVTAVDTSDLEVARWARDEDLRKGKYVIKPDDEIQRAIQAALVQDPRVDSTNVRVQVLAGIVTLRGAVANLQAKQAAAQDARHTVGVINVKNRLKVRPSEARSDEAIAEDIRNALERDPYLERYEIVIDVIDGTVYLNGMVDSYFEKAQADIVISGIKGVEQVENDLIVDDVDVPLVYEPYLEDYYPYDYDWYDYRPGYTLKRDSEIREDINDELWWSPFVDAEQITVTVEDGVATLTGAVDSWSEFNAATENAYEGGATWVRNQLEVGTSE